jgi:hypothetical protein
MLALFSRDATPSITAAWSSLALVCGTLGQFTASDWPRPISDPRILEALQTIEQDFAGVISGRRLADQAGLSTSGCHAVVSSGCIVDFLIDMISLFHKFEIMITSDIDPCTSVCASKRVLPEARIEHVAAFKALAHLASIRRLTPEWSL